MSIKQRILLGFGGVMALVVVMGGLSAALMGSIQDGIQRYGLAATGADDGREMEGLVTRIKVPVNQWLRSLNANFVGLADGQIAELSKLLARLDAEVVDPGRRTIVSNLLRTRDVYTEHWRGMQTRAAQISESYAADDALAGRINQTLVASLHDGNITDPTARDRLAQAAITFAAADAQFIRFRASENPQFIKTALDGQAAVASQIGSAQQCGCGDQSRGADNYY